MPQAINKNPQIYPHPPNSGFPRLEESTGQTPRKTRNGLAAGIGGGWDNLIGTSLLDKPSGGSKSTLGWRWHQVSTSAPAGGTCETHPAIDAPSRLHAGVNPHTLNVQWARVVLRRRRGPPRRRRQSTGTVRSDPVGYCVELVILQEVIVEPGQDQLPANQHQSTPSVQTSALLRPPRLRPPACIV